MVPPELKELLCKCRAAAAAADDELAHAIEDDAMMSWFIEYVSHFPEFQEAADAILELKELHLLGGTHEIS